MKIILRKYYVILEVFMLIYFAKSEDCSVNWELITSAVLGQDVQLKCTSTGGDSCFGTKKTFKWIGGPKNDVIAFGNSVSDHDKYVILHETNEYTLTIKNASSVDFDVSYVCHRRFHFHKEILQEKYLEKFQYFDLKIDGVVELYNNITLFANTSNLENIKNGIWVRRSFNSSKNEKLKTNARFRENKVEDGHSLTISNLKAEDVNMTYQFIYSSSVYETNLTVNTIIPHNDFTDIEGSTVFIWVICGALVCLSLAAVFLYMYLKNKWPRFSTKSKNQIGGEMDEKDKCLENSNVTTNRQTDTCKLQTEEEKC